MSEETKEAATPKKKATGKKKSAPKKSGAKKSTIRKSPKKRAAAASTTNDEKVNQSEFILQFGPEVKPLEIVEKAKAKGVTIDAGYAASVRSKAKDKGTWPRSGQSNGSSQSSDSPDVESEFMRILNKLGTARAKKLFALYAAARGEG